MVGIIGARQKFLGKARYDQIETLSSNYISASSIKDGYKILVSGLNSSGKTSLILSIVSFAEDENKNGDNMERNDIRPTPPTTKSKNGQQKIATSSPHRYRFDAPPAKTLLIFGFARLKL